MPRGTAVVTVRVGSEPKSAGSAGPHPFHDLFLTAKNRVNADKVLRS